MTGVVAAWLLVYALSLAPAMRLMRYSPCDVRMVIAHVPYAPVCWLLESTPLGSWSAVKTYHEAWSH